MRKKLKSGWSYLVIAVVCMCMYVAMYVCPHRGQTESLTLS